MIGSTTITREPRSLTFERTFPAPRESVWRAFSDESRLRRWWGPRTFPVVYCTLDFRPGGVWHYCLRADDGREHWARSVYQEIEPLSRIVYIENSSDPSGAVTDAVPTSIATVTFTEAPDGTVVRSHIRYHSLADRDLALARGIARGQDDAFDQLHELLATTEGVSS